jgi:putative ABC transport system permease protein
VWLLSLRDLQWRRRRFIIAVLATSLIFSLTMLMSGALEAMKEEGPNITQAIGADAWLVAQGATGPFTTTTAVGAAAADEVGRLPGVQQADPLVLLHTTVGLKSLKDVNVVGHRPGGLGSPTVSSGRAAQAPGEVVADTALGADIGDEIRFSDRTLRVVGEVKNVSYYFGAPTLFVSLDDAQQVAFNGQPLAMTIVTRGVPQSVPSTLKLYTPAAVRSDLNRALKSSNQTIGFINALLWLVAIGIVGSIVYLSALERTRDFAVLKATGATSLFLFVGLALQAVLLSVASAALGIVLAHLLAPGFPFRLSLTASSALVLIGVAILIGLLASGVGLRRAASVDPALAFGGA